MDIQLRLKYGLRAAGILLLLGFGKIFGQDCPPNLDFERGNFDGWTCYTGTVANVGGVNTFTLSQSGGPVYDRHTLITASSAGLDPYGGFPTHSPNGSAFSIKLGNDQGGGQGEAIEYEFTIPAGRDKYSLIYRYAVVFQDPNHQEYEQPRMEIVITNVTDNSVISCASFSFIPYGTPLPGFFQSPIEVSNTPIWCKDWTPVSINLDGMAGKTIKLMFRTGDCTFRRHFGYAYIDVDSECSGEFVGASYCPDDSVVNVVAPYGFQNYTWYDSSMNKVLGTSQILIMKPPPPPGTKVNVRLTPYQGYGCPQTLTARLVDNLKVTVNAGRDTVSCNLTPVQLGSPPKAGLVYSWTPTLGLSNPAAANPYARPDISTQYVLDVRSTGGGCRNTDTVMVKASILDTAIRVIGRPEYCLGSGDSAVLQVSPTSVIVWLKDGIPIAGADQPRYQALQTGVYLARLADTLGCVMTTAPKSINISSIPAADFRLDSAAQCLAGNRFVFTNASTNAVGEMRYRWVLGSEGEANTRDLTYSFTRAGNYEVKLVVNSNNVCADSMAATVTIYPNAVASFTANPVCVQIPLQIVNNTDDVLGSPVRYLWNLGNGQQSADRQPPAPVYSSPGTYRVSLSVFTDQCPTPVNTMMRDIVVDRPPKPIRYPIEFAVVDQPLTLQARKLGDSVLWSPATFLSATRGYSPVFTGSNDQQYLIQLKTRSGCLTVDTLLVQTVKEAEIYVATGFTPNGDGKNDYLRPVMMGIQELRYFRIFNRWGQLLYESRTDKPGWDGTIGGIPQASQSVVWMVEGLSRDGRVIVRKGTSVLIR